MHRASNLRQNWIAILDLKSAYDRVCRATLMKRCDEALPEVLSNMVSHIIQELEVHIVGDETGMTAKINRGVTRGGPASPTLFNIYIDTLASQLCASVGNIERTPVRLYADDVIALADSLWELVLALRICSKWANEKNMEWSMDAAKSHILPSPTRSRHFMWLSFATGRIQTTTKAKYLGVQVTARGIIPGLHIKKYQATAHQTKTQLRRARIIVTGMTPQFARLLYVTLILSKLDYASILTPVDGVERSERVRLDMRFFKTILGIRVQPHHVLKLREIFRIEAPYWGRRRLCQAFSRRLLGMAERGVQENEEAGQFGVQARRTLDALESNSWFLSHVEDPRKPQCPQQQGKIIIGFKKKMIKKWKRPFSILKKRLPVGLRLGNWKQRKIAVRWHPGNFPRHDRYLRKIGLEVLMIEIKLLTGCDTSMKTTTRICAAIAGITAIDERKYSERSIT